ncbi:MAG: type II toxin-antitoxin system prevent-host-death family antitoxin [Treponema sp.]|nr:type II toxin-antitoxin system prevent-host-death family antitoxin [Treponema sp.]
MTAPLYDIKARFSEYVTMAENGEVVEITKHGTTTAVIISLKMFNELNDEYQEMHRPSFVDEIRKWKARTGGLTQEEAEEFIRSCEEDRYNEIVNSHREENPWL